MDDQKNATQHKAIGEITPELKTTLNETRAKLKGSDRRRFMAQIVLALGPGGQSRAQRENPQSTICHICSKTLKQ